MRSALRAAIVFVLLACVASSVQSYKLTSSSIASSGGTVSAEGYALSLAVGIPVVGLGSGEGFSLDAGFFPGPQETPTGIADEEGSQVPNTNHLWPNYPNPFNPVTTIKYSVAENSHVAIRVYDVQGKLISTLVDQPKAVGEYAMTWAGVSASGDPVASGVYFVRMTVGAEVYTIRIVLLK